MNNLLIIGCGDIARRTIPLLAGHFRLYALLRNPAQGASLRGLGVTPLSGDLDDRHSLRRLAGLAQTVLYLAPPDGRGARDGRTRNLLAALAQGRVPARLVYISTSGVYGDCAGAWVSETRPPRAQTRRALLRLDAEQQIRHWAARNRVSASILRVPGIYAAERLPLERLRAGLPAILAAEDGYSNHIHADDLARILLAALRHARPNRIYHAVDDDEMRMGDYFDAVADAHGLPHPPRLPRAAVQQQVSPMMWSFMNESRRLRNDRMKRELCVRLRYPGLDFP
ncbi:SDR family oxidoreductase [Ferrigenium sp. UT5]|uniref:SDR family oxidoreductase n=1 Tax=Ferrigenium sp. UT5 TaxID=3242105 RepID=UPI0035521AE9